MKATRLLLLALLAAIVAAYFALDLGQYLSLDYFKAQQTAIESYRASHPWQAALVFFLAYVAVTGVSLPGVTLLTLAGGAIFGLPLGALLVTSQTAAPAPAFAGTGTLVIAGLIVGIGTRLGSGCTSGHGVCGVSRLSQRSIVATVTFMAAGIATVAAMNALGLEVLPARSYSEAAGLVLALREGIAPAALVRPLPPLAAVSRAGG